MARRTARAEVVTIYWRDIPVQVNGQLGRERHQVLLPERFQRAVDLAKHKARIRTADADVAQWRRESAACSGDVAAAAEKTAAALEADCSDEYLGRLAYVGGFVADLTETDRAETDANEMHAIERGAEP